MSNKFLADTIFTKYSARKNKDYPIEVIIKKEKNPSYLETYLVKKDVKKVTITAYQQRIAEVVKHQIQIFSDSFFSILKKQKPKFLHRLLFISCPFSYEIHDRLVIPLPSFACQKEQPDVSLYVKKIIEMGYNMIVFCKEEGELKNAEKVDYQWILDLLSSLRREKIKIYLEPIKKNNCLSCDFGKEEIFKNLDGIFWQAEYPKKEFWRQKENKTLAEILAFEIQSLEKMFSPLPLLYYFPLDDPCFWNQSFSWFYTLIEKNFSSTFFSFPFLEDIFFWETCKPYISSLFPVFFTKQDKEEEQKPIWFSLELEKIFSFQDFFSFEGIGIKTNNIPLKNSYLAGNLWVSGQFLWLSIVPKILLNYWVKSTQFTTLPNDLQNRLIFFHEIILKLRQTKEKTHFFTKRYLESLILQLQETENSLEEFPELPEIKFFFEKAYQACQEFSNQFSFGLALPKKYFFN